MSTRDCDGLRFGGGRTAENRSVSDVSSFTLALWWVLTHLSVLEAIPLPGIRSLEILVLRLSLSEWVGP